MFGNGFTPILNNQSPLKCSSFPFLKIPFSSATIRPSENSKFTVFAAATVELNEARNSQRNVPTKSSDIASFSKKTRQSAIIAIQESSDLDFALSRYGDKLKVQDLNVILRHFGKLSRWKELSKLFAWMQQNEKTNIASYSSYIKFLGESLNPIKALEIYNGIKDELTRTNVSVCNSLLSCLVKNGKFDSSLKMFHQMKREGLKPDIITYSTVSIHLLLVFLGILAGSAVCY